ncbi:MAG: D-alanyl-D-alanine carboxypeptidase, partial [Xanthomarina sp.]
YQKYNVNDIAYYTNQRSVNLFAEELLCLIGYEKLGVGTTEKGLAVEENYWKSRIDVRTIELTDGSGLSRTNAISSYHFTELLKYMDRQKSNAFENTLPVAGKSGTLLHVCKGQAGQGRIVAKSGTMSRIKSYAGYVNTQSGKKLAFAIIVNNFLGSSSILVNKMEKIFNAMALL